MGNENTFKNTVLLLTLKILLILWGLGCFAGFIYSVFYRVYKTNVTFADIVEINQQDCKPDASGKNTFGRSYVIKYNVKNSIYKNNTPCVGERTNVNNKIAILYDKSSPNKFVVRSEFYINTLFALLLAAVLLSLGITCGNKKKQLGNYVRN